MGSVVFPYVVRINAREILVFSAVEVLPPPCAFCSRSRTDTLRVASNGRRIEAVYERDTRADGEACARTPICWACIRDKTRGAFASSLEWRAAIARFLNKLNADDPHTLYCEIQSLG